MAQNEPSGFSLWGPVNYPWPIDRKFGLRNRFLECDSHGISIRGIFRTIAKFRWEEISQVYFRYEFYFLLENLAELHYLHNPRIVGEDGSEIEVRGTIGDAKQLLEWIDDQIGQRQLDAACEDFACGRPVTFGDLIATRAGLHGRGTTLDWYELRYLLPHPLLEEEEDPFPELLFYNAIRTKYFPRPQSRWRLFCRDDDPGCGSDRVANLPTLWKFVHRLCTSQPSDPWYPLVPVGDDGPGFD